MEIEVPLPPSKNIKNLRQYYNSQAVNSPQAKSERIGSDNIITVLSEMYFHVRFTFDRNGFSFIHHSINNIVNNNDFIHALFNINSSSSVLSELNDSNPHAIAKQQEIDTVLNAYSVFNLASRFNDEQKTAITDICHIVRRGHGNHRGSGQQTNPYIIYGPPGT